MSEAAPVVEAAPKTHLLELAEQLFGEKSLNSEKALQALHDDEYERLTRDEKRTFFGDIVRRELARNGLAKGQLAMSQLNADTPTQVALAALAKVDAKCKAAVDATFARLRTVAIDCVACENLVLPRFKAEDDRCRVCGEILPVSSSYGVVEDAAQVAALIDEPLEGGVEANGALAPDTSAPAWEVVAAKPDLTRLLALSKENEDWDEVLAAKKRAEEEARRKVEEEARKKAEAEAAARKKAEDEARAAREKAEAEARKKAEEEARKKAEAEAAARKKAEEEAKKKAEAEAAARKKAEEEAKKKAEAEAAARRKAEEEAALAKAQEEAKKKAEEAARKKAEAEAELLRRQEEEAAALKAAEEAAKAKAEEEERLRKIEQERPAIGCLTGGKAGQFVRIPDLDPNLKPSGTRPLCVIQDARAKILVPSVTKAWINETPVSGGIFPLKAGDIVKGMFEDDDLCVIEATGELQGVTADPVHFKREDGLEGGPWPFWNEPAKIGSDPGCEIHVNDEGVDDFHALVTARFGRVVIEDACKHEDGVWVNDVRVKSLVAKPGTKIQLGSKGPTLAVMEGQVEVAAPAAAGPMKPARYVRTCLHVQTTKGEHQKIFLFARREVRFGKLFSRDELKVENDLVIAPADDLQTVGDKQGSFSLTREGVTVRRDDRRVEMSVNDEELNPGQSTLLKREFTIEIGTGLNLQGQVYRAPASKRADGPPALGIEGGHPNECVKMVREGDDSGHTYVFLVRQIRLGSGENDSIKLPGIGVQPGHAVIQLSRGILQIIAPREKNKVKVDGQILKPGVPHPLKLGSKILMGECLLRFEVVTESDFKVQAAAVS